MNKFSIGQLVAIRDENELTHEWLQFEVAAIKKNGSSFEYWCEDSNIWTAESDLISSEELTDILQKEVDADEIIELVNLAKVAAFHGVEIDQDSINEMRQELDDKTVAKAYYEMKKHQ